MAATIKKFNPLDMDTAQVLALATGREQLLESMLDEMKSCLESKATQHYMLHGPRGIGKSFFTRLLKIHHDRIDDFNDSLFIQLPEEQDHINFSSDLLDTLSTILEGGVLADVTPRWAISNEQWSISKKRLKAALETIQIKKGIQHVFVTQENLQDFLPTLDDIESGRMREFLSDFPSITIIGSSLRPNLDNDYSKRLFQVFKKIDIIPWSEHDYICFYERKANQSDDPEKQKAALNRSRNKIKAIAKFTGGSPRLAVIMSSLILEQNILETTQLLDGIIDDLTTYYQDLTKDIPPKSKILFDMLIRKGENMTQSNLAKTFDPPLQQSNIARSFAWLLDNYYLIYNKVGSGNTKHFYVRDRLYVLYYQKRQVFADQPFSFVGVFVDFLTEYYSQSELYSQLEKLDTTHPYSRPFLLSVREKMALSLTEDKDLVKLKSELIAQLKNNRSPNTKIDQLLKKAIDLAKKGKFNESATLFKQILKIHTQDPAIYASFGNVQIALNDYVGAAKSFENAVKLDPENSNYCNNLGYVLDEKGDISGAIKAYKQAIKLQPDDANYYNNLAIALNKNGNHAEATKALEKAITLNPVNAKFNYNLGIALQDELKYAQAINAYERAIALKPENASYHYNLGNVFYKEGDHTHAIRAYKRAIALKPEETKAHYNMAFVYYLQQNWKKMRSVLQKGLAHQPLNVDLITALVELDIIENSWDHLVKRFEQWNGQESASIILGRALSSAIVDARIREPFHLIKQVIDIVRENPRTRIEQVSFISTLCISLYRSKQKDLLETILGELDKEKQSNPMINMLIETMNYLNEPTEEKLALLHPDARTVAISVQEFNIEEK